MVCLFDVPMDASCLAFDMIAKDRHHYHNSVQGARRSYPKALFFIIEQPANFTNFLWVETYHAIINSMMIGGALHRVVLFIGHQLARVYRRCTRIHPAAKGKAGSRSAIDPQPNDPIYLEQLFENAQVGILMAENDGTVIRINPEFQRIFGYTADECIGRNADELVAAKEQRQEAERITRSVSQGNKHSFEAKRRCKDGTLKHMAIMASPIVVQGRQVAVYGFYRDVTLQRQMEAELIKAKQLEATGRLAGGIAHDFNNLLTIILGNIDLGLTDLQSHPSPLHKTHLEQAKKFCLRAYDLTQKFITFSAGNHPKKERIHLTPLLKEEAQKVFGGDAYNCRFEVAEDLWRVEIDAEQFRQVLSAIFSNAHEAMPGGGDVVVHGINLSTKEGQPQSMVSPQTPCVQITIRDNGNGVPAKAIQRLFDPYYSTKKTVSLKGLGLGLTVAHSIVHQHGGHIQLESQENTGTSVHIILPAAEGQ